ncbi:MAG: TetR/AcrR family transcriptional regulator [Myxococcota bacterium]
MEALIRACACVLEARGFAGTTTNHIAERAGVNIASLYQYFPGKDALVALVADRLVRRILDDLSVGLPAILETPETAMRAWVARMQEALERERTLINVFREEVPYVDQLPAVRGLRKRLVEFSDEARRASPFVHADFNAATLHLAINLTVTTLLELDSLPDELPRATVLDELAVRLEGWVRGPRSSEALLDA